MINMNKQHGYILLPVVILLTLVATVAFMLNNESALDSGITSSQLEAKQADYVARAGLSHGLWQLGQQGCGPYTDLNNQPLDSHSYTTTLTTGLGSTTAYTLAVDQDTWIRSDQPTDNKATDGQLHIRYQTGIIERPMYRYDVSPVPAGSSILSATAWFYVSKEHPEGPVDIHLLNADWTETDATWDSMGANMDPAVQATIPTQPVGNVWVPVNLTAQVQAWVKGAANFGITLNSVSEGTHGDYASIETAQRPYLEVIVGTPPSTPTRLKSRATMASGITRTINLQNVGLYQQPSHLFLQPDDVTGKDAWLTADKTTWNYGKAGYLRVRAGGGGHWRSPIQFDLGRVPHGAQIRSATLELYRFSGTQDAAGLVNLHAINRSWVEGDNNGGTGPGVTWDLRDLSVPWNTAGGDYDATPSASIPIDASADTWYSADVTSLVQQWVNGSRDNHGMMLVAGDNNVRAEFRSSDEANAALRPKLTLRYACECGSPCMTPQGSGTVLMVVINPTTLVPMDAYKKALFESWGYTVSVVGESSNQSTYDAAIAAADVVFISETVNASQVGTKLANASIGVVSQDGIYNNALGIASGNTWTVASAINVSDTSHYITAVFPTGPLEIYGGAMEQLIVSGGPAPGAQILADTGGAGSLVVLDTGAIGTGGTPLAGRRVMLPLGRDANFNWDYLNAGGRLLLHRALRWGMGAELGAPPPQLLFVAASTTPTAQEQLRIDLIESWGYGVNVIDDNDSQANYDAAITANDVAYVSSLAIEAALDTKLKTATIGVVNEQGALVDEFGFGQQSVNYKSRNEIDVLNNTHYITEPFATGLLTIVSVDQSLHIMTANKAAGFDALAQVFNTGSLWDDSLGVIETGGELFGGGAADGRRVLLPWGDASFDVTALNADGLTLMQRAIEWAATVAGPKLPVAHWKLDETSGTTAVDSEGGHHGTLTNDPTWDNGIIDGALAFDGSDDYIDLTSDAELDDVFLGGATVVAWVYAESWGENNFARILDKSSELAGDRDGWMIGLYGDNQAVSLVQGFTGGRGFWRPQAGTFPLNEWVHVAIVYDSSSDANDPTFYQNGIAQTPLVEITPSGTIRSDADITLRMGNHAQDTSRSFDGKLDDVRIYDQVLSASDIAKLAAGDESGASPLTVLFVVGNTGTLSTADAERKSLLGGWGYTVTVIDDGDSQANFDTSAAAADVAYVTESVNLAALGKKLKEATIGVVNEDPALHDVFGFSTNRYLSTDNPPLATDAAHYITAPFGGATVLALFSSSQPQGGAVGTLPSGLQTIGTWNGGSLSPLGGLLVLDAGAAISGGGTAAGRRVQLPWGGQDGVSVADITALTTDGKTILQRALEWGANAGGSGGGPGPGNCDGTFRDEFNLKQYDQNDGSLTWATNWEETGETTDPTANDIRIDNDISDFQLMLRDDGQTVMREADLSEAGSATLSFDYRRENLSGSGDYVAVEVSYNGGSSWTELDRFTGDADDAAYTSTSYPLDAGLLSANTRIRFKTPGNGMKDNNQVWFDNIQIQCSP
jgi:hypothetical protein